MKKFDVVLLERELSLTKKDIADILSILPDGETFIPLEIEGEYSAAMGFITYEAADRIDFLTDKDHYFYSFIKSILDDMEKEKPLCVYTYEEVPEGEKPLRIMLTRDLEEAVARLNRPAVGFYCISNTGAVLIHEIDPRDEWVVASLNGDDMQQCEITQAEKDDVETGFYFGEIWIPMDQVMRV